jgi:hypothetical protein
LPRSKKASVFRQEHRYFRRLAVPLSDWHGI